METYLWGVEERDLSGFAGICSMTGSAVSTALRITGLEGSEGLIGSTSTGISHASPLYVVGRLTTSPGTCVLPSLVVKVATLPTPVFNIKRIVTT